MSKSARKELIESLGTRYQAAGRPEKGASLRLRSVQALDELVAATGYHRCYAMTLLGKNGDTRGGTRRSTGREPKEPRHRKGTYTAATFKALEAEARQKPAVPTHRKSDS